MFTLFAVLALLRGWYRTADRHSCKAKHKCDAVRDGMMNKWAGEIANVGKRLEYYRSRNVHLYKLATGTTGRMA